MATPPCQPARDMSAEDLRRFFISHLNRIYCAKSQLVDKLPLLGKRSHFLDLQQAIGETIETVQLQIERMKKIYIALNAHYQHESCVGLLGILDEAFQSIGPPLDSPAMRDLSILFYMQNIEAIEKASFGMLMFVADRMQAPEVKQLLLECYDDAGDDKALFHAITRYYLPLV